METPLIGWPWVSANAPPAAAVSVTSVIANGGTSSRVMNQPCRNPTTMPIPSEARIEKTTGQCQLTST